MLKLKKSITMSLVVILGSSCAHYEGPKTEVVRNVAAEKGNETGNPMVLSMPCKDRRDQVVDETWAIREKEIKEMGTKMVTNFFRENNLSEIKSIKILKTKYDKEAYHNDYSKRPLNYITYQIKAGDDSIDLDVVVRTPLRHIFDHSKIYYDKRDTLGRVIERGYKCIFSSPISYIDLTLVNPESRTTLVKDVQVPFMTERIEEYVVLEK